MHVRWLISAGAAASVAHVAYATQYLSIEEAQKAAFPQASQFVAVAAPDAATAAALGASAGWSPRIVDARNGDNHLGYVIVDQVIGKSELITYALALDAKGAVLSIEILDYRESHGGEVRLAGWRRQFVGKTAADPVALNTDIKNISGATLSSRHLTEGVQRLLKLYQRSLAKA
jgi:Na+-translocating ferredoxin:NAD+ oxidoreductase RnfG subunit